MLLSQQHHSKVYKGDSYTSSPERMVTHNQRLAVVTLVLATLELYVVTLSIIEFLGISAIFANNLVGILLGCYYCK